MRSVQGRASFEPPTFCLAVLLSTQAQPRRRLVQLERGALCRLPLAITITGIVYLILSYAERRMKQERV